MSSFPQRTYVQEFDDRLGPESQHVSDEMKSRNVPVHRFSAEQIVFRGLDLKDTDLIVGDFNVTRKAMKMLSIPIPDPPDYPECLKHMLHRKIWTTTLGKVGSELKNSDGSDRKIFVKPSAHVKLFSGLILTTDWLSYLLSEYKATEEIYCSEVVKFLAEYRVYCVNGELRACCHYAGDKSIPLDMEVVNEAVTLFSKNGYEGRILAGCGIDFGIIKKDEKYVTALIEVNDGISLGSYEGISRKDYTDMLAFRWKQLVDSKKK